jgi:hypothetical protein
MKRMRIIKDHDVHFNPDAGFGNLRAYKKSNDVIDVLEADVQVLLDAGAAERVEGERQPRESIEARETRGRKKD